MSTLHEAWVSTCSDVLPTNKRPRGPSPRAPRTTRSIFSDFDRAKYLFGDVTLRHNSDFVLGRFREVRQSIGLGLHEHERFLLRAAGKFQDPANSASLLRSSASSQSGTCSATSDSATVIACPTLPAGQLNLCSSLAAFRLHSDPLQASRTRN